MSAFKDMVAHDIDAVFMNVDEFAVLRTIRYDGEEYVDVPVVLDQLEEKDRKPNVNDHAEGLYRVTDLLFCSRAKLGGKLPEVGQKLKVNNREGGGGFFRTYYVASSTEKNGMLQVGLGAIDE